MLIKEHPDLQPWPPTSGLACVGPPPSAAEVGALVLRDSHIRTPARLVLAFDYNGGDCIYIKNFRDASSLSSIHITLQRCVGMTLRQIGDVEIR